MVEFLRVQYRLGRLNAVRLAQYAAAGRSTEAQYGEIVGTAEAGPEEAADE